jgi:hypothetical protein
MLNKQASATTIAPNRIARVAALTVLLGLGFGQVSFADDHPATKRTIAEQFIHDMKEGKIGESGADDHVVQELIIKRSIPITYKYINILMNTPNAFGPGVACTVCHNSNDPSKSYRGLDLSTCKGMIEGSTEKPKRALFKPGTDPKRDILIRRLRNNRMPLGQGFENSTFTPNHMLVKQWIADGAKNDDHFNKKGVALVCNRQRVWPQHPGLHGVPHVQSGAAKFSRAEPEQSCRHHAGCGLGGQGGGQGHQGDHSRQT